MCDGESPPDRCLRLGAPALSAVELLALILGEDGGGTGLGLAQDVLENFVSLKELSRAEPGEIATVVSRRQSLALVAAFELGRRAGAEPIALHLVESPEDAAAVLASRLRGLRQEAVVVLHLGARHQVLRVHMVALGGLNSASIEARDVFRGAVANGAAAIVLGHNHPSGCPEPSEDDVRLTQRLVRCGRTLGIEVLDHLVLGDNDYVSLRERSLIEE